MKTPKPSPEIQAAIAALDGLMASPALADMQRKQRLQQFAAHALLPAAMMICETRREAKDAKPSEVAAKAMEIARELENQFTAKAAKKGGKKASC